MRIKNKIEYSEATKNELAKRILKRTQRKIEQMFREPQSAPS